MDTLESIKKREPETQCEEENRLRTMRNSAEKPEEEEKERTNQARSYVGVR
jgi:hypothetical protein